jgi:predicted ATPase
MYGTDSAVVCASYEGHCLWFRGYPDAALPRDADAVRIARELGEAHSLALALAFSAGLRINRRAPAEAMRLADEVMALSTEQHLAQWIGTALVSRGIALAELGRAEDGVAAMFEGLSVFQATGARIAGRYFVAMLAAAHGRAGRFQDGLAVMDAMLPLLASCEDVFWDSEIARTRAELLSHCAGDEPGRIEALLREALTLARNTDSKVLELRAAGTLAAFLGRRGDRDEGLAILAPVFEWFTEGFDTLDLRDAAGILAELAPQAAAGLTARTST